MITDTVREPRILLVPGLPDAYREAITPIFHDRIEGLMCMWSAKLSKSMYSLYIQGLGVNSHRVKGARLNGDYRLQLNLKTGTIEEEIYYFGYACHIPERFKPLDGLARHMGTSIFYGVDGVINTLLINLEASTPLAEIQRVTTLANMGVAPANASFVRLGFDGDSLVSAMYLHKGGSRVTATR